MMAIFSNLRKFNLILMLRSDVLLLVLDLQNIAYLLKARELFN